jgi:protein O-mannosyl-transferase
MPQLPPMPRSRQDWLLAAALAAVALAAFAPALRYEFVSLDDNDYVTLNPHVREGLTLGGVIRDFYTLEVANWHPLTWLSLQLDASLWKTSEGGPDPRGFHLTNVLLHAANAALLFLALRALTGASRCSAFVALFFAVHPLRVESVAWVAERKDVLSMFFGLLALWAYAGYARAPSVRRYATVALTLALSLMAKPMLVTLPFLLLVLDWWPLGRARDAGAWRRLAVEKLPFLGLVAASCVVTYVAQVRGGATLAAAQIPFAVRAENAVVSYVAYLAKTFWPFDLVPFYPHPGAALLAWQVGGASLLLVLVTAGVWALRRRKPYLLTGWLWFLGTLVPVIGLVQVGNQAYADRYSYFPQIGILLAACWAVADLATGRVRVAVAVGAVAAVALTVRTEFQLMTWRDSYALWKHALQVNPKNAVALISLGTVEENRNHPEEAESLYREALTLEPDSSLARLNLGSLLARQGHPKEAVAELTAACELTPTFARAHTYLGNALLDQGDPVAAAREHEIALGLAPDLPESYFDLARDELALDHLESAAGLYREALKRRPDYADAHFWIAKVLLRQESDDQKSNAECMTHLLAAVRAKPDFADAHLLLGQELYRKRDFNGAAEHFDRVVGLNSKEAKAWFGLGMSFVRLRRLGDAEHCLSRAVELDHASASFRNALAAVLEALAAAQAADGHLPDAMETERRALDLAKNGGEPELLSKIEENLRRYERGETGIPRAGSAP